MKSISSPASKIIDFLKYLAFKKSASFHTLKAYALDLSEAFQLGKVRVPEIEAFAAGQASLESSRLFEQLPAKSEWCLPRQGAASTRNRKIAALKSFFRWGFEEQIFEQDYGLHLSCPKKQKKLPHFISVDEAMSVLQSFAPDEDSEKLLFLLLYGGGLRVSEACQLRWSHVNLSQKTLLIQGKGNKQRLIALPPLTWDLLLKHHSQTNETYVFGEQALSTRKAYEMVRRSGQKAGLINPLHPHALRHSFATHLLSSGANLRILQKLLGHDSLQATEIYTHLGVDQLARTLDNLHPLGEANKKVS
ncbi:MAG: tyrosine-type recombinase/integrase [Bdellovibrionia bacterium]